MHNITNKNTQGNGRLNIAPWSLDFTIVDINGQPGHTPPQRRVAADEGLRAVVAVSTPTIARGLSEIAIRCPALLVVGERDQVAPPSRLASLGQAVGSQAELVVLPGADHFWWGPRTAWRLSSLISWCAP